MAEQKMTNYAKYFGTPERAAMTLMDVSVSLDREIDRTNRAIYEKYPEAIEEWSIPPFEWHFSENVDYSVSVRSAHGAFEWLSEKEDEES